MAYLTATDRSFVAPVDLNKTRDLIERFCKEAFPGTRAYRAYNGRISVGFSLGEGAYASLSFETRDLTTVEKTVETPPLSSRVTIGGTMSGVNVNTDTKGRAEVQRFFDEVSNSLQRSLEGFAANGHFRASLRFGEPGSEGPESGIA